jgi:hypothetical protein
MVYRLGCISNVLEYEKLLDNLLGEDAMHEYDHE